MKVKVILNPKTLLEIDNLYKKNNWDIRDYSYDAFCRMMNLLTDDQQKLMLELSEDFFLLDPNTHYSICKKMLYGILDDLVGSAISKLYFLPVFTEENIKKRQFVKSSVWLTYLIKGIVPSLTCYQQKLIVIDSFSLDKIPKKINTQNNSLIILIDDFIGTGSTILNCISFLSKIKGIESKKIIVSALVGQEEGINIIEKEQVYKTYILHKRKKGITDKYSDTELEDRIKIMESIEAAINVDQNFRFGYGGSEALVKMNRTPNNTFPIYWYENGGKNYPPFPR